LYCIAPLATKVIIAARFYGRYDESCDEDSICNYGTDCW
jgi:hypothetical protein